MSEFDDASRRLAEMTTFEDGGVRYIKLPVDEFLRFGREIDGLKHELRQSIDAVLRCDRQADALRAELADARARIAELVSAHETSQRLRGDQTERLMEANHRIGELLDDLLEIQRALANVADERDSARRWAAAWKAWAKHQEAHGWVPFETLTAVAAERNAAEEREARLRKALTELLESCPCDPDTTPRFQAANEAAASALARATGAGEAEW